MFIMRLSAIWIGVFGDCCSLSRSLPYARFGRHYTDKSLNMAAFTAVLVNIPLNWLLIFGFDMGISGAAIASSFAEMCSLAVLAAYMFRHIDKKRMAYTGVLI